MDLVCLDGDFRISHAEMKTCPIVGEYNLVYCLSTLEELSKQYLCYLPVNLHPNVNVLEEYFYVLMHVDPVSSVDYVEDTVISSYSATPDGTYVKVLSKIGDNFQYGYLPISILKVIE